MLVKASDLLSKGRRKTEYIPVKSKQGALFAAIESEKVAIAFSGAGAGGEEDAIESAVRTKMVEESPVDGIIAVIECALPSDLTLD